MRFFARSFNPPPCPSPTRGEGTLWHPPSLQMHARGHRKTDLQSSRKTAERAFEGAPVRFPPPLWGRDREGGSNMKPWIKARADHPQAAAMAKNSSDLRLAPPTSAPSTSSTFISSWALAGLTEPP